MNKNINLVFYVVREKDGKLYPQHFFRNHNRDPLRQQNQHQHTVQDDSDREAVEVLLVAARSFGTDRQQAEQEPVERRQQVTGRIRPPRRGARGQGGQEVGEFHIRPPVSPKERQKEKQDQTGRSADTDRREAPSQVLLPSCLSL